MKEIAELEGLIPEIREKIADTKDMQQETLKKIGDRRLIEDAFNGSASKDQNGSANKDENGMPKLNIILIPYAIFVKDIIQCCD